MTTPRDILKSISKLHRKLEGKGRFTPMLVTMFLLFVLFPFLEVSRYSDVLMSLKFGLVIASGVYASKPRTGLSVAILVFGVLGVLATVALHAFPEGPVLFARDGFLFIFCACTAVYILRVVLRSDRITADSICGAVAVFLLLGLMWALLYAGMDLASPDSFIIGVASHPAYEEAPELGPQFSMFVYYSFNTITTLGNGDIIPLSRAARMFSWLEAVLGQLYLVVLVAHLVGLHVKHSDRRENEKA